MLQHCTVSRLDLSPAVELQVEVGTFGQLVSCIPPVGRIVLTFTKSRLAFINLRCLWCQRDVLLSIKFRVCAAAMGSALLYGSETWQAIDL